ncbi:MAG TPA: ABC transporter ATP-binding protein [Chthoniobacterales bacterium]|jgi:lipopolysaccharide transport system ATP-binding protein
MSKPIIEVSNLSKRYNLGEIGAVSLRDALERGVKKITGRGNNAKPQRGEFWALNGLSFDVQPGEVIGLIGRNGAGKSTALKILSRITEPTSGYATLRGRVASLLEVGTGFHPELSGRENVFLNGAILGMKKSELARKFDEIVAFAEIEKFIDTPVKRYSSGMYVRLAFAVAAHLEPEILIVDEVLAVGDQRFQRKCIGKMQEVSSKQGRTILFVSHSMETVMRLCNRAVLMDAGKVIADGTPASIVPKYYEDTDQVLAPGYDLNLLSRPRKKKNVAQFASFRYDVVGDPSASHPSPGSELEFTVTINAEQATTVGGLALYFETTNEVKVLNFDIQRVMDGARLEAGKNTFVVRTPPIPINSMTLRASLWMADASKTEVIDELHGICNLDFIEGAGMELGASRNQDALLLLPKTTLSVQPDYVVA